MGRVVTESASCCHSVQAAASGKYRPRQAARASRWPPGVNGAAPVAETLTGLAGWQADAPLLMHAQDLGAKDDLVLTDEPLGVGRSQELAHLDGLPFFLRCQQSPSLLWYVHTFPLEILTCFFLHLPPLFGIQRHLLAVSLKF